MAFIDTVTSDEMAERFVKRVAEGSSVFWLRSKDGAATSESNELVDPDGNARVILLFFSDAAYARSVQQSEYRDHEVAELALFDFLFRWLPGMTADGVLAGLNWRADLCGPEREPFDLRTAIEQRLPAEVRAAHAERYRASK